MSRVDGGCCRVVAPSRVQELWWWCKSGRPAVGLKHFGQHRRQSPTNPDKHSNIACWVTRSTAMCDKRVGTSRCRASIQHIVISTSCLRMRSLNSFPPSQLRQSWANATSSSPSRESTTATALWQLYTTNGFMDTALYDNASIPCTS